MILYFQGYSHREDALKDAGIHHVSARAGIIRPFAAVLLAFLGLDRSRAVSLDAAIAKLFVSESLVAAALRQLPDEDLKSRYRQCSRAALESSLTGWRIDIRSDEAPAEPAATGTPAQAPAASAAPSAEVPTAPGEA